MWSNTATAPPAGQIELLRPPVAPPLDFGWTPPPRHAHTRTPPRTQASHALDLLSMMTVEGVAPNAVTYNAAISACGKGRRWAQAIELLREMDEAGVRPNKISYNAAISACEKGGQWARAVDLLVEMENKGVLPDAISYNAAIR